jgi:hypothetical protein
MLDDLFVPDPKAGDSSNQIADTRFVQSAIASTVATSVALLPQISSLTVVANLSTVLATAVGTSLTNTIDALIGSTPGSLLLRNSASWVTVASTSVGSQGAIVLLNTLTANGVASITDTSSFTSAYTSFEVKIVNLRVSNGGAAVVLQYHSGGAFASAGYTSAVAWAGTGSGTTGVTTALPVTASGTTDTANGVSTATLGLSGLCTIFNPSVSSGVMYISQAGYANARAAASAIVANAAGLWNSSGVVDGFALLVSTGTFTATIKVYGVT